MTEDELATILKRNPAVTVGGAGTAAKLEPDTSHAPLAAQKVQGSTGQRFLVRVTSVRKRLFDESNLCYKYHEDLCRYAGALPSDAPQVCHSEVRQRKAEKGEQEHTEITVWLI